MRTFFRNLGRVLLFVGMVLSAGFAGRCATAEASRSKGNVGIVVSMAVGQPSPEEWVKIRRVMQPAIENLGYRFVTDRAKADVILVMEYEQPRTADDRGSLKIDRVVKNQDRLNGTALSAQQSDMMAGVASAMSRH